MMDQWYYQTLRLEFGPVTLAALIEMAQGAQLSNDDRVKNGTDGEWREVGSVNRLALHLRILPESERSEAATANLATAIRSSNSRPTNNDRNRRVAKGSSPLIETQSVPVDRHTGNETAATWWCRVEGIEYGPVTFATLRKWVRTGQLHRTDSVRPSSTASYVSATGYRELFPAQAAAKEKGIAATRQSIDNRPAATLQVGTSRSSDETCELSTTSVNLAASAVAQKMEQDKALRASDDALLRTVADSLAARNISSFARIGLDVQRGTITAQGNVASEGERLLLIRLLRETPGVVQVNDGLSVTVTTRPKLVVARRKKASKSGGHQISWAGLQSLSNSLKSMHLVFGIGILVIVGAASLALQASPTARQRAVFRTKGILQLDGKPMTGATVLLNPVSGAKDFKGVLPRGIVDADGTFQIGTYSPQDGAPAGDFVVTILWCKAVVVDGETQSGPNLAPPLYARPETSPLKASIKKGSNDLEPIELTSAGRREARDNGR
jgi:osmotically-inducible protein OsmY